MSARKQGVSRLVAALALGVLGACGASNGAQPTMTTVGPTTTGTRPTTTLPSLLPPDGTIPLSRLVEVERGDDLVTTAQRALEAWRGVPAECLPSRAEALAARDQFIRVETYLRNARAAARELRSAGAFKALIDVEAAYRSYAASRDFLVCGESKPIESASPATSTTIVSGTAKGLTAGGVAEVDLTITGTPKVDREFTVADVGTPCDGIGANTTFLVNSQDGSGRWVITDVIVNAEGSTSAPIVPTRAGAGAIEYLAYCGTLDKRHGVVTYRVSATGDTTTTQPTPTTTDPSTPLQVVALTGGASIVVDPRATEVAVEPESVTAFLSDNAADGGVVIARMNLGDWVALRTSGVTWVPVGPGDDGLDLRVVGAKVTVERTLPVSAPSASTISTATATATSESMVVTTVSTTRAESGRDDADTTLWVVIALVVVAALTVLGSRLRR
ncbi:MAG: hypothetical protein RIQ64_1798 [Actinomycetota bacterium]|jgi:hypothetical protein